MARIGKNKAIERIGFLRGELNKHNYNYYVLNAPVISDFEYDLLMQELQALEALFPDLATADSPTLNVGSDLAPAAAGREKFRQVAHRYPMLSLSNTYDIGEMREFDARIARAVSRRWSYSCELKFDGVAICLTYRNGELAQALTRGDGTRGDDVTRNVMLIPAVPKRLAGGDYPAEFEIRGEIYMPFADFERVNREREEDGETPFANPRNAAAGSLKQLDPLIMRERGLSCVLYHILGENLPFATHSEALGKAAGWGLPVSASSETAADIDGALDYISRWDTLRHDLPFATDGVVIKVNELDLQRQLGFTAKSPRWATAYKFKPEVAETRLVSIDYQVGRTGAVTPVANLEPVPLSGTVVKRASLHNKEQMDLLDIRIGDWVYVEKGGEIIPKITGVNLKRRPADAALPAFPEVCPDCGTPLVKDEAQARHYCPGGDGCPEQIKGRFIHFVSRRAMDILAGEATVEMLYEAGHIRRLSDLYHLGDDQLMGLKNWKERSVENFRASLAKSLTVPFPRVLYALGIRHVGETTAKSLASVFRSMDAFMAAGREEFLAIPDIGEVVADSIIAWCADENNRAEVERLRLAGVQMEMPHEEGNALSEALKGLSIVVSGNFSISREELKGLISAHGGRSTGSVSGSTDYLLAGEKAGPEKLKKAEKLGIKIIGEEEFFAMLPTSGKGAEPEFKTTLF